MAKPEDVGTVRVRVTSIDGRTEHPFRQQQSVGDVHQWAYEHLVKDKSAVAYSATWMEYNEERVDDSRALSSFGPFDRQTGRDIGLTLGLAWTSQGGAATVPK